jgi:hypothetical protein
MKNYYDSTTDEKRSDIAGKIMRELNNQNRHQGGLFDCGDLGFCLLQWRTMWHCVWYEPEPLPWEKDNTWICKAAEM